MLKIIYHCLFAFCLCTSAYSAISVDFRGVDSMNADERKTCGIDKLTAQEKLALNAWLEAKTPALPVVEKTPEKTPEKASAKPSNPNLGEFAISDIQELGHIIKLENGMSFKINSRSRKRTMAWKKGEKVQLVEPVRQRSFKLTNVDKKQTVSAKEK